MKIGAYFFYLTFTESRMFESPSSENGEDDIYSFYYLASRLREMGHEIEVIKDDRIEGFDALFFYDTPPLFSKLYRKLFKRQDIPAYLFINENPAVKPLNWIKSIHRPFKKVFLWNKDWVDNKKYFFWVHLFKPRYIINPVPFEQKKLSCIINHQKYSPHPSELFSERTRAVRWFEQHAPDDFELWGDRWDRIYFRGILSPLNPKLRVLYRDYPNFMKTNSFPSWKGRAPEKYAVLREHRFCICMENANFPGYVTEKMYDAIYCGCVPVFKGCKEVYDFFPKEVFWNLDEFNGYCDLYERMKKFTAQDYLLFLESAKNFLNSQKIRLRNPENFVKIFNQHILSESKI